LWCRRWAQCSLRSHRTARTRWPLQRQRQQQGRRERVAAAALGAGAQSAAASAPGALLRKQAV
jgi:hypothetical protein